MAEHSFLLKNKQTNKQTNPQGSAVKPGFLLHELIVLTLLWLVLGVLPVLVGKLYTWLWLQWQFLDKVTQEKDWDDLLPLLAMLKFSE